MFGLMQDRPLLISSLIDHAATFHPHVEIVGRTVEGPVHRTNYREVQRRSKQVANAMKALGVAPGDRVPLADARETVLKLRAGKGMVLDAEDHDTWSAGSFFTNPILTDADFAVFHARVRERLGDGAEPPAYPAGEGHTKTSAAWLIDKAGFTKGYGSGPARILSLIHI